MTLSVKHLNDLFGGKIPTAQVLQGVATGMADQGVKVVIDPDTVYPCADPATKTIYLPPMVKSARALLIVSWYVDHEAGHIIYTPPLKSMFKRWLNHSKMLDICKARGYNGIPDKILEAAKWFHNFAEDARIENLMIHRFPGCKKHFIGGPIAAECDSIVEDTIQDAKDLAEEQGKKDPPLSPFWVAEFHANHLLGGAHGHRPEDHVRDEAPPHILWVCNIIDDDFGDIDDVTKVSSQDLADRVDSSMAKILDKVLPDLNQQQPQDGNEEGEGQPTDGGGGKQGQEGAPNPHEDELSADGTPQKSKYEDLRKEAEEEKEDDDEGGDGGSEGGSDDSGSESEGDDSGSGDTSDDDVAGDDGSGSGSEGDEGESDPSDEDFDASGSGGSESGEDEDSDSDSGEGGSGKDDAGSDSDDASSGDDQGDASGDGDEGSGGDSSEGDGTGDESSGAGEGEGDDSSGSESGSSSGAEGDGGEGEGDDSSDDDESGGDAPDHSGSTESGVPSDSEVGPQAEQDATPEEGDVSPSARFDQVMEWATDAHVDMSQMMREAPEFQGDEDPQDSVNNQYGNNGAPASPNMIHAKDTQGMPEDYLRGMAKGCGVYVIQGLDLSSLYSAEDPVFDAYDIFTRKLMPTSLGPAARRLVGKFQGAPGPAWTGSRINPRMLQPIIAGKAHGRRLMMKRHDPVQSKRGVCVALAIDCSGSMCSGVRGLSFQPENSQWATKFTIAHAAARSLARLLQTVGVPFAVTGFTTKDIKVGRGYGHYGCSRSYDIVNFVFKNFEDPWTSSEQQMLAMNQNTHIRLNGETISAHTNSDGESILWLAQDLMQRSEDRKILIVLSDGLPYAGDSVMQSKFLRWAVRRIEMSGIKIGGLGLGDRGVASYYSTHELLDEFPAGFGTEATAPLYIQEKLLSLIDKLSD